MKLEMFQVDAFSSEVFGGNPAAVVPLERWLPTDTLQKIAVENNLSETGFFIRSEEEDADFDLRWFTPGREVDLCGHATVASAHVLANHLQHDETTIRFSSASGILGVSIEDGLYTLDFPSRPGEPLARKDAAGVAEALGAKPGEILHGERDWLAIFETEDEVRAIRPDMTRLGAHAAPSMIISAPGNQKHVDFVSRFFAPKFGIPEDPVTGSAHCTLVPYWAERLGKKKLFAQQVSARGGELFLTHEKKASRVLIGGRAVTYLVGRIEV